VSHPDGGGHTTKSSHRKQKAQYIIARNAKNYQQAEKKQPEHSKDHIQYNQHIAISTKKYNKYNIISIYI
jgi:hypothetical protein